MKDFHSIILFSLITNELNNTFTYGELCDCKRKARKSLHLTSEKEVLFNQIIWLTSSHYELEFSLDTNTSERVIFPISANEKNGVEDAGFVKFVDDDGKISYYATYTAYDGTTIMPNSEERGKGMCPT
ncbi:glycoside hydrolase family protein [Mariniphaga sediminis]|nr:hypothetical protein [Mariniphaga sediminis]